MADHGLRVLHVVDSGERRGAEVFTSDLVKALNREGVEQHVAVVIGLPPFAVGYDVPAMPLDSRKRGVPGLGVDTRAVRTLRRLVESWSPSVVQTHGGATLKYCALAVNRDVPLVARVIGMSGEWATRGPRRLAHARLLRRTTAVAAVADAVKTELIETFGVPEARVRTIPNAADPARLAPIRSGDAVRADLGIPADAPVLISICALTWEKDPRSHLEVTKRLHQAWPDMVHLIVGDGPMRSELERDVAAFGLTGRVRVLGSRPDVADLLSASDVLLFASRRDGMEGMPAAVIEAGMAGIPVAGFAVAGVPEVVLDDETGLLVPSGDINALVEAVRRLLADPALRLRLGSAARDRCSAGYTIDAVAQDYLAMYALVTDAPVPNGHR